MQDKHSNMMRGPLRGTYSAIARKLNVSRSTVQQQYKRGDPRYVVLVDREKERRLNRARRLYGDRFMELIGDKGVKG